MPEYMINGIPVNFPYEPYSVQTKYMEKVIECLKQGVNGMLESPTGTGKTLCLLCASLSWLTLKKAQLQTAMDEHMQGTYNELLRGLQNEPGPRSSSSNWRPDVPKIIYATRTHSQLSQVMQELKKTGYGHIKVAILGSRDQLCIHPEVLNEESNLVKIRKCQSLTKNKSCYYHYNLDMKLKGGVEFLSDAIMDIEDLVKAGQKQKICPYFLARELKRNADIVFIPYNYILDKKRMKSQGISLEGSVVILDEAHNVEKICEESVSIEISSTDIALCISEVTQVMENIVNEDAEYLDNLNDEIDLSPDKLCLVKTLFLELEKAIDDIELNSEFMTLPGTYIIDLLAKAQLNADNCKVLMEYLEGIATYLTVTSKSALQHKGAALQKVIELVHVAFNPDSDFSRQLSGLKKSFKVYITKEEKKNSKKTSDSWNSSNSKINKTNGKLIKLMCFTPSYGMNQLLDQNLRCVIFTSGTLSPLPALVSEFGIPIPVSLENPHVIGLDQVMVSILTKGADGYELNSSFRTRDDPRYISSLGNTLLNICRIVPHGLLVFFASYPIMYNCRDEWQRTGLWNKICNIKPIFVEPKKKETFTQVMNSYYDAIQDPITKGACFMAVTRGKVSEGLDFMDVNGRAVVVTGLPYPPFMDVYVKLKMEYLKENHRQSAARCLAAEQWYLYEATRAVNQAIGRIIRHKDDYGAIILCDSRFDGYQVRKALSSWVQPHIRKYQTFGPVIRDLKTFFVSAERSLPPPKVTAPTQETNVPSSVGASFDSVVSRVSSSTRKESPKKQILLASDVIFNHYVSAIDNNSNKRERSPEPMKKLGLFNALEKSTSVIDFNNLSAGSSSSSVFKWTNSEEPMMRTKKLKVAPPRIMPLSQESEELISGECSSKATKILKPLKSNLHVATTSQQISNTEKCNTANKEGAKSSKPKSSMKFKEYLIEVRKSLDSFTFMRFTLLCFEYDRTKDFKKMLTTLQDVMLGEGRNCVDLFRQFKHFLKSTHKEEFDMCCLKRFGTLGVNVPPRNHIPLSSDVNLEHGIPDNYNRSSKKGKYPDSTKKLDLPSTNEKQISEKKCNSLATASSSTFEIRWTDSEEAVMKTNSKIALPNTSTLSQKLGSKISTECDFPVPNTLKPSKCSSNVATCSKQPLVNEKTMDAQKKADRDSNVHTCSKQPQVSEKSLGSHKEANKDSNVPTCSKQPQISGKSIDSHKEIGKDSKNLSTMKCSKYFLEVRKSLDFCSYEKFKLMCIEYDKTGDFKNMITALQNVMLEGGRNYTNLFKHFRCFVKPSHREDFDKFCEEKLGSYGERLRVEERL